MFQASPAVPSTQTRTGTRTRWCYHLRYELEWWRVEKCFTDVHWLWNAADESARRTRCSIRKEGRPIGTRGSAVDCPRGLNSAWAFVRDQKTPSSGGRQSKPGRKSGVQIPTFFSLNDWTVLEKADRGMRCGTAMAQSAPSVGSPSTGKY